MQHGVVCMQLDLIFLYPTVYTQPHTAFNLAQQGGQCYPYLRYINGIATIVRSTSCPIFSTEKKPNWSNLTRKHPWVFSEFFLGSARLTDEPDEGFSGPLYYFK